MPPTSPDIGHQLPAVRNTAPPVPYMTNTVVMEFTPAFGWLRAASLHAVTPATVVTAIAAEMAADGAPGPGIFAVCCLDALHHLDRSTIATRLGLACA